MLKLRYTHAESHSLNVDRAGSFEISLPNHQTTLSHIRDASNPESHRHEGVTSQHDTRKEKNFESGDSISSWLRQLYEQETS
jgi:hypothetical protein